MLISDQKADILDRILELLQEDMHLEQVCYCKECYYWGLPVKGLKEALSTII